MSPSDADAESRVLVLAPTGRDAANSAKILVQAGLECLACRDIADLCAEMDAGAGVVGGRVIGKSDKTGAFPTSTAYTPFDVGATIYQALGVTPDAEIRDATNRPNRVNGGEPMAVLFQNR